MSSQWPRPKSHSFPIVAGLATSSRLSLLIIAGSNEKSLPGPAEGPRRLVFRGPGVQRGFGPSSADGGRDGKQ
jgi:hypothetical protein